MNSKRKKPYVIDVGDNQVFSADFVFEQIVLHQPLPLSVVGDPHDP